MRTHARTWTTAVRNKRTEQFGVADYGMLEEEDACVVTPSCRTRGSPRDRGYRAPPGGRAGGLQARSSIGDVCVFIEKKTLPICVRLSRYLNHQ